MKACLTDVSRFVNATSNRQIHWKLNFRFQTVLIYSGIKIGYLML